jgi:hypothetical protein
MSTTALTPTHHKGGVGAVVAVVASVAIPFAAPMIVSSIAGSMALTAAQMTIASAAVGGFLGAAVAAVTGGNPLLGGLSGAVGGGLGGFAKSGGFSGIGGPAPDPTGFGGVGIDAASGVQYASGVAPTSTVGLTSPTGSVYGGSAGDFAGVQFDPAFVPEAGFGPPPGSQGQSIAAQLSGSFAPEAGFGPPPPSRFTPTDPARAGLIDAADVSLTSNNLPSVQASSFDTAYPGLDVVPNVARGRVVPSPQTFGERVSSGFDRFGRELSAGVEKALDPKKLAEKGLQTAADFGLSKAAEYFADEPPVSPEEEAQLAFLDQQRAEQGRLQGEREKIALGFANQARSVPVSGQAESNAAKIAAARAGQEFIRGGSQSPAAVASRQRQVNLAAARRGGTAQIQGRTGGLERQADLFTAAANTLPTGASLATGAAADLAAAEKRFLRQQKEQSNFADIFGGLLPTGAKTAAQREEDRKRELGAS